jgi:hypothetical protein
MAVNGLDQDYLIDIDLVRADGVVVAEYDDVLFANGEHSSTFLNNPTVVFPVGTTTYALRTTLPASTKNGTTITLSADPASGWNGTWAASGSTISFSSIPAFNMGAITVTSI